MSQLLVASPPEKPLLVFDGDCDFCRFWIARWRRRTGDVIAYEPFQNPAVAARFSDVPRERFVRAVQLIEPDGRVFEGAHAVFRSLAHSGRPTPLWPYEHVPGVALITESVYRFIARHRGLAARVTAILLGGADPQSPQSGA